ncbi:MAG: prepilin-type N-terminal cleavage/methylation domain-containing protein [Candidatus Paceibacterota bacterium]
MNKILLKKNKISKGFSLVEMLVYIAIMSIITIVLVQSFVVVLKSNKTSFADSVLRNSGYSIMENIIREVRSSKSINQCSSGVLELVQSNNDIVRFYKNDDGLLLLSEGNPTLIDKGFLNSKGTEVLSLSCIQINTIKSKAVKVVLILETGMGGQNKSETFYSTIILRGSY